MDICTPVSILSLDIAVLSILSPDIAVLFTMARVQDYVDGYMYARKYP